MKKNIIIIILTIFLTVLCIKIFAFNTIISTNNNISCNENYKKWTNNTYKFSMCLPNSWQSMNWYWKILKAFNDNIVEIWEPIMNQNSFKSQIYIENDKRLDIKGDWYWITDPIITKIEWNKLYVDGFERLEWNNLVYKWSLLFLYSWDTVIRYFYDNNNEEHKIIMSSVQVIN